MAESSSEATAAKAKQVWVYCNIELPKANYEAAMELFKGVVAETRKEKGCLKYGLHLPVGADVSADPVKLSLIEQWESLDDLNAHLKSEHLAVARPKFAENGIKIEVIKSQSELF